MLDAQQRVVVSPHGSHKTYKPWPGQPHASHNTQQACLRQVSRHQVTPMGLRLSTSQEKVQFIELCAKPITAAARCNGPHCGMPG